MNLPEIQAKASEIYTRADHRTRGVLEIIRQAFLRFSRVQGPEAAAAIAFYTIFSIFPLLLLLISAAGFLLKGHEAVQLVLNFVEQVLPAIPAGLEDTLRQIVARRDVTGIIGLIGLVWSASAMFTTLARNVNRAWPDARRNNPLRAQLIAFGLIAVLIAIMIVWVLWSALLGLLASQNFPILERYIPAYQLVFNPLAQIFPWIASFLLFYVIYRWLPNTAVRRSEAFWGALLACAACGILTGVFSWYLRSGIANYDLLYGSLGTSIALLTWVFMGAMIILFGAHLSASIARATRHSHLTETSDRPSTR
jgi:membrane protein